MVGVIAQRRPDLGSVHDVIVAVTHRPRLHRTQIRTVVRLGKALTPNLFAGENIFDVFGLLFIGTHIEEQWTHPVQANGIEDNGRVMFSEFFIDNILVGGVRTLAAILTGPVHAQIPGAPQFVLPLTQKIQLPLGAHL